MDFEGIAEKFNVNIRVYELKVNLDKTRYRMVYRQKQYKEELNMIYLGMLGGHCFYIKKMDVLKQKWKYLDCKKVFTRSNDLSHHTADGSCNGGKTKIICNGKKIKRILISSEKVFYGGLSNYSYSVCQWIEHTREETGKHIHHALCGHVIHDSVDHEMCKVDDYEPITKTIYQYYGCKWHGCTWLPSKTNADENQ